MVRGINWLVVAVAGPVLIVASMEAVILAMALFGDHPRWPDSRLNVAEAAAVRENAEVIRLLERGDDPNARRPVRPGLLGNEHEIPATPLEAAVSIRRPDLIELLFEHGARPTPLEWLRLRCAAQGLEYGDVVGMLDSRRPAGLEPTCSGDERLW